MAYTSSSPFHPVSEYSLDGSHRVSFAEVEAMARGTLELNAKALSRGRLQVLWKALDQDASGFITMGELSRFLRIAEPEFKEPTSTELARRRLLRRRSQEAAALQAETDRLLQRHVARRLKHVEPATREELKELGDLLIDAFLGTKGAAAKQGVPLDAVQRLFRRADLDGSGRIEWEEFEWMVRQELRIGKGQLSEERLWRLWKAIDGNENGYICTGEFHRFMKSSLATDENAELIENRMRERAESVSKVHLRKLEEWSHATASASSLSAKAMEAEAARLEKLLQHTSPMRSTQGPSPLSKYEPRHLLKAGGKRSPKIRKSQSVPALGQPTRTHADSPEAGRLGADNGAAAPSAAGGEEDRSHGGVTESSDPSKGAESIRHSNGSATDRASEEASDLLRAALRQLSRDVRLDASHRLTRKPPLGPPQGTQGVRGRVGSPSTSTEPNDGASLRARSDKLQEAYNRRPAAEQRLPQIHGASPTK